MIYWRLLFILSIFVLSACRSEEEVPSLVFRMIVDSTQTRLNNFGQPAQIPSNHRAQSPKMNRIAIHYIELISSPYTPLGEGEIIYQSASTTKGGSIAIDFEKLPFTQHGIDFLAIPLSEIKPGEYSWIRVSLAYQNYDIQFRAYLPQLSSHFNGTGTVASFVGYNQYIEESTVKSLSLSVYGNRRQGYWGFEAQIPGLAPTLSSGLAPAGATTVPNPLFDKSPIPQGSCVVTGVFSGTLKIDSNATKSMVIELRFSTQNSFEWRENGNNNTFDPLEGDTVVDMGIRGLIPVVLP
jgi:hypothetical protein